MSTISTIPCPRKLPAERKWHLLDAKGKVLGRFSSGAARILMGKDKTIYTPAVDCGDFVVVVNASAIVLTKDKAQKKIHYRHSGYLGGLKEEPYGRFLARRPEEAIRKAVWGMLPKNRLGRRMITRLKVYRGAEHPHAAQFPASKADKE